jgi:hypothetical protein
MAGRNGQELLSAWVPVKLAQAFKAHARGTDGGTSAALRRLITQVVDGKQPAAPAGVGVGQQVSVRIKAPERALLAEAARVRATSPANWLRSLAIVHLARRPQWNEAELDGLRDVFNELRRIGNNVNQIARALNVAVQTEEYPPHQGLAVREAAEAVRTEMRRAVAMMTGNFDYWGLPLDARPTSNQEVVARSDAEARAAEKKRKTQPRRRPARFKDVES